MTGTKRISFSMPTAHERLAALGLAEEEIERGLELVGQKYGPVYLLIPGEYTIELPIEETGIPDCTNQDVIDTFYAAASSLSEKTSHPGKIMVGLQSRYSSWGGSSDYGIQQQKIHHR